MSGADRQFVFGDLLPLKETQMNRPSFLIAGLVLPMFFAASVLGQDMTVGELKSKGATMLTDADLKTLLPGVQVRYENAQYRTQMRLNADGTLAGRSDPRIGGTVTMNSGYNGEWRIENGRWCAVTRLRAELGRFCRDVLKLDEKYYYAEGNRKNDGRA